MVQGEKGFGPVEGERGMLIFMIQPKYTHKNNTIFMGFDSIEINLVDMLLGFIL